MNFIHRKSLFSFNNILFMERNGEYMKKTSLKLLLFSFVMSLLMIIPTNVNAEEIIPVNISVKYGQTEARRILDMINELRTSPTDAWAWDKTDTKQVAYPGLKELVYDYDLERLAMKRAAEIALSYDHTRPNGQNPFTIYTEENITRRDAGENIAVASPNVYSKAEAVNNGWREDNEPYAGQGHRRNMLDYKFTCVGVGHVTYNGYDYWVEEFASRPSINTTETPANDSEQTVTVSVTKSWITNYKTSFDQDSYVLRLGETLTPNITPIISLINQLGSVGTVLDTPTVSINDPSIATYSDGKIIGLKEGTTTLTTSLYGLPSTTSATIIVHDCDNHWDGGVITKVPTCIVEGERTYTCAICNNTKIEKIGIDATNHLHSGIRNQKEASCKEEGYSGDKYCPDCGTKLSSGNTIAKTENHSWNNGVITKEPTCVETGVKTYTCGICNKTRTENIAKTTEHLHTEIRNKKAATCGETGYTGDTYCTDCGTKVSSGKTIAKLTTHTWDEGKVTTEPTCTAKGVRTFTCSICAKTKTASIAATGHQHTEIRKKKDATCGEDGYTGNTYCTDCKKTISYGQTIKKTGNHTWDDGKTTTEPTCTINGITTFTCSVCGKTKTRSIKAAGHSYGEYVVVKEPTSTEKGLKSKTCSVCGKVYSVTLAKTDSSNANIRNTTNSEQNTQTNQYTTKKIKLNRRKLTLKRGKSFKLKVTLTPINSRDKITYVTSNKKVVKVYRNGRIKALKKGKANITVISGNKKVICRVTVK